jgi:D-aminoacyl-tRNA deacylase
VLTLINTYIIASKKDPAGMNIVASLKRHNLTKINSSIHVVEEKIIRAEGLDKKLDAELFVFASKHVSKVGTPSLSCHVTGNFGKAEYGGKDHSLSVAPALVLKAMFMELQRQGSGGEHEITLEATHHGPFNSTPSMFIEIGSEEEAWEKEANGQVIASVIISVLGKLASLEKRKIAVAVGIGGGHYCDRFNKIQLGDEIAIGHVIPKYNLGGLSKEMIQQAVDRCVPKADSVVLDWKGLGKEKQRIISLLQGLGVPYKRSDQL